MIRQILFFVVVFSVVQAEPLRIVSYSPGATQTLVDLKCANQIIAATPWCPLPDQHPASRDCDAFNPDLEKLLQKNPTLIILPRLANPLWASRCQEAGLRVLILSPESKNSVCEDIGLISAAVHQENFGNTLIANLIKPQTRSSQKVLIIWDGMMAGKNSYLAGPLEKVGCEFPFPETTWIKYDLELIAQFNPEIILWINSNPSDGPITVAAESLKEFENLPVLKTLNATRNKKIFKTNSGCNWLPSSSLLSACSKMDKLLKANDLGTYLTK